VFKARIVKLIDVGFILMQYPDFTLLDIRRSLWRVQMTKSNEPFLDDCSGPHFLNAAKENARVPSADIVEQREFCVVAVLVLNLVRFLGPRQKKTKSALTIHNHDI